MIEVQNVSKSFAALEVLRSINLRIEPGSRVAFIGANGSGKTTLLRAIVGLVRVQGRVLISGVDVAKAPGKALVNVAYIPQIAPPLDAPVAEVTLALARLRGIDPERVRERAQRLGLDIEGSAAKRFRELSGGMKQKLLAAVALAFDSEIVVCDEPTANLDAEARQSFFEQLRERDRTVILCSHRIEEVRSLVDRVVELREGRILRDVAIACAPLERALRASAKVSAICDTELEPVQNAI